MSEQYPEHAKLAALAGRNQEIGEFIEWLDAAGYVLARWRPYHCLKCGEPWDSEAGPVRCGSCGVMWSRSGDQLLGEHRPIEVLLAEYFGIDLDRLEAEKRRMLEAIRNGR
jgi:hypothetical protein